MLKWNVDDSSKGKPEEAGMRGVLRDEDGVVKGLFTVAVRI